MPTFTSGGSGGAVSSVNGHTGSVTLSKTDVGLSNVTNVAQEAVANKNAINGYAGLDSSGLIPAGLLPSYVDDVLEYTNLAGFPATGETGKIYVDKATSKIYRWSGSTYVEISPSPGSTDSVTEGATNLYFTTARAAAAAPVQSVAGRSGAVSLVKADVDLGNVDNTADSAKSVLSASKLTTRVTINGVSFDGSAAITVADSTKEPAITAGNPAQYYRGDKSFQTLDKSAVGLSNVDNTSDAGKPVSTATATALAAKEATANKNAVNGYAGLDSAGLVPASLLPSFVDDVLEYAALGNFPATGESGKIYVATGSGKIYRWSGSTYVEISPSPGSTDSVTEGSTNLYFTAARADARITAATGVSVQPYSANLAGLATTGRNFQTNLASTAAVSFNGSADNTHGVTGTLPASNGGTGLTAPGASGNVLTSNGSAWVSSAPTGGGAGETFSPFLLMGS
jgi:hypothetical protein